MLGRTRLLLPLVVLVSLVPAAGAQAAKATFSAVFEAKRSVKWDQPRGVSEINCRGENYYLANGGEEAEIKTKPFRVTVEGYGKAAFWKFAGGPAINEPDGSTASRARARTSAGSTTRAARPAAGAAAASILGPSATAARSSRPTRSRSAPTAAR